MKLAGSRIPYQQAVCKFCPLLSLKVYLEWALLHPPVGMVSCCQAETADALRSQGKMQERKHCSKWRNFAKMYNELRKDYEMNNAEKISVWKTLGLQLWTLEWQLVSSRYQAQLSDGCMVSSLPSWGKGSPDFVGFSPPITGQRRKALPLIDPTGVTSPIWWCSMQVTSSCWSHRGGYSEFWIKFYGLGPQTVQLMWCSHCDDITSGWYQCVGQSTWGPCLLLEWPPKAPQEEAGKDLETLYR